MNAKTQQLIEFAQKKFGLDNYQLKRHRFDREVTPTKETIYTMSMEWFPNEACAGQNKEEDLNPEGTAVIEIDVNREKVKSAIFVMGTTYAHNGITFPSSNTQEIIRWAEAETGLIYGKQFMLHKEKEGELQFRACWEGLPVSPAGYIEVHWNPQGLLTSFSVYGQFPASEQVEQETYSFSLEKGEPLAIEQVKHEAYSLSLHKVEPLVKEQIKLAHVPSHKQNRWLPVYAVEEVFITNDQLSAIPIELSASPASSIPMNRTFVWESSSKKAEAPAFTGKEIQWLEDITEEQAYSHEPSPDTLPITNKEQEACVAAVKSFLVQEKPEESGKWTLKRLHREKGYLHATLRTAQPNARIFQRKLIVLLDASTLQVHNVIDNQFMLDMYESWEEPAEVKISPERAYTLLKSHFELSPCYVYDAEQNRYRLCGKFDCNYAIDAISGDIVSLDEL